MKVYNEKSEKPMSQQLMNIVNDLRNKRQFNAKEYIERKSALLNEYMNKCRLKSCVVGVSGGIDSAIVLGMLKHASMQDNSPIKKIIPMLLPLLKSTGVTNQEEATKRGEEWCNKLGLKPHVVDLTDINNTIRNSLESVLEITGENWAIGQLGPYSRTPVLYYTTSLLCQKGYSAIVCGTINTDEGAYLGYLGKASDGMVDVQMISDIHKSEVYQVARELDVPRSILEITPNGDMYDNRTDEMVFGAPYDFVELYLNYLKSSDDKKEEMLSKLDQESSEQFDFYAKNLENLHQYNSHKYLSKSPSIHLDLWDSSVKGGWDNYYKIMTEFLQK